MSKLPVAGSAAAAEVGPASVAEPPATVTAVAVEEVVVLIVPGFDVIEQPLVADEWKTLRSKWMVELVLSLAAAAAADAAVTMGCAECSHETLLQ